MLLEFKLFKVNEDTRLFKLASKHNTINEFIVVGEGKNDNKEYYKVHQLTGEGLKLFCDLPLDEMAYSIEKKDLIQISDEISGVYTEIDIPKEYLTLDLIETIKRLNG